tara:strand:- start:988 stop:1596 length:609 start_codon:yes stop_codon:yes gene_type:complete
MKIFPNITTSSPIFRYMTAVYSTIAHKEKIDNFPGMDFTSSKSSYKLKKENIITNLNNLFKYCINPIAYKFGTSNIKLTSVYRTKEVNKLIGGVENSQHIYGYAADLILLNHSTSVLFNWCKLNIPEYHQLIWEYPEIGDFNKYTNKFSWIHISYIKGDNFKINSVSSTNPKIHKAYEDENTFFIDGFTHNIQLANQQLLEE